MRLFKYMGSDDVRVIKAGDKFGGQLAEGITKDLVFSIENHWMVDVEELGLSETAIKALAQEPGFQEVNPEELIPHNENQRKFHAHSGMSNLSEPEEAPAPTAPVTVAPGGESVVFSSTEDDDNDDGSQQEDPPVVDPTAKPKSKRP